MKQILTQRLQTRLHEDTVRSIFRCPQCGSFFDAQRTDPHTGSLARKCSSCEDWYPVVAARRASR